MSSEDELRSRAEELLAACRQEEPGPADAAAQELLLHRAELEVQNEQLRQTELMLQEARDRYFDLFDLAPVAYLTLDRAGRIVEANLAAASLLGTERDRLVGRGIGAFVEAGDLDALEMHRRDVLETGTKQTVELGLVRRDRTAIPARLESIAAGPEEDRARIRTAVVDLTELKQREAVTRLTFEASPVAMLMVDEAHVIRELNAKAEVLFGYERSELIGRSVDTLVPADLRDAHRRDRAAYSKAPEARAMGWDRELFGRRRDGSLVPLDIELCPFETPEGRRVLAAVVDLSERRLLEAEARQAQKMEAVGALAAGVAHDFNNLLMGVMGCAKIAARKLPSDSPARVYLEEINEAAHSGAAISSQLLAFSRKRPAAPSVFDLHDAVGGAGKMLERLLGEDVELAIRLGAKRSLVRLDRGQMEQVLMNLAVNARDAMPDGGRLLIETSNVTLDGGPLTLAPGEYVRLRVSDTGAGMSVETMRHVFDPFFTTKELGRGTGLGLSTVHGIITGAGGRIDVDSELGRGTTFEILMPSAAAAATGDLPVADLDTEQAEEQAATILLVEDEEMVRMATRFYLEEAGYEVIDTADGPGAIAWCRRHPGAAIDLLLTDVVLPGMGGGRTAEEIGRLRPGIPVIFMSAHAAEWLADQGRIGDHVATIQKPFGPDVLLPTVREALGRA